MRHGLSLLIFWSTTSHFGCLSSAALPVPPNGAPSDQALPSTALLAMDGTTTDLRTVLRGRVAVVSLWATWCDACLGEIDALGRLHALAAARGDAIVVGVAVGESRETVAAFAQKRRVVYAEFVDEGFHLADALGEPRVPTTLVVDRAGRIIFRGGALDSAGLAAFRSALTPGR